MRALPQKCHVCSQLLMIDTEHLTYYVAPNSDHRSGWCLVCTCGASTPLSKTQAQSIRSTSQAEEN
jgi:hypothetical protein